MNYLPTGVPEELCQQKQILCYEYIDSLKRLNETSLPPNEVFYNRLHQRAVPVDEYAYAQNVWRKAGCQTLNDYVKMYCEIDAGMLAYIYLFFLC